MWAHHYTILQSNPPDLQGLEQLGRLRTIGLRIGGRSSRWSLSRRIVLNPRGSFICDVFLSAEVLLGGFKHVMVCIVTFRHFGSEVNRYVELARLRSLQYRYLPSTYTRTVT